MIQGIIVVAISLHWQPGERGGGGVGHGSVLQGDEPVWDMGQGPSSLWPKTLCGCDRASVIHVHLQSGFTFPPTPGIDSHSQELEKYLVFFYVV